MNAASWRTAGSALLVTHLVTLLGVVVFVPARLQEAIDPVERVYSLMAADIGILCFAYVLVAGFIAALLYRRTNRSLSRMFFIAAACAAVGGGATIAMHVAIDGGLFD